MLFDLVGEDLQAAAVDHRADASVDPHEPVVVDPCEIAGAQPTVSGEPVADIVGRRRRPRPHLQLVVAHPHLDARVRPPHRAELPCAELLPVGRGPADHFAAQLRLAVAVEDRDAEPRMEPTRLDR